MLIPAHGYAAIFDLGEGKTTFRPVHAWNEDGHPMYVTEKGLKDATKAPNFLYIREWNPKDQATPSDHPFGMAWDWHMKWAR